MSKLGVIAWSDVESDEWTRVGYAADAPRKRDFWKVIRGKWQPEVRRVERLTVAGLNRTLKEVWSAEALKEQMFDSNPLLGLVERKTGKVPITRPDENRPLT